MKEQARRVLGFSVKLWGMVLVVFLAMIGIKIIGAGGVDQYLKKTWSALEVYGLVCLVVAEFILLAVWLCFSRTGPPDAR